MELYLVRIAAAVIMALVYMLFDIFNKRNVPTVFVYATLAVGFIFTILYFNVSTILTSVAISLVVLGLGYVVYKIGQLGGADVVELAALSLIIPIQSAPILFPSLVQLGLPFIVSLLVNTGIIAIIIVPLYYIPKAKAKVKRPLGSFITKASALKALLIAIVYLAFIMFVVIVAGVGYVGVILLLLLLLSSSAIMLFSVPITYSMVDYVNVGKLEEGDIIAFNLMTQKAIDSLKKRVKGFDRLVTRELMKRLKESKIKDRLPVYKEAMPFALPIFIALVVSLLVGNLLLFILAI